jgi:nucleotide-binding universal stress UspA family protein
MYSNILIAIEHSDADRAVLSHVQELARLTGARLLLVHVADGWAARHFDELKLRESEEIRNDREYLGQLCEEMVQRGFEKVAAEESVDLIAMSTHGHRFLNDLLRGSTADRVRHNVRIPVLMVRA